MKSTKLSIFLKYTVLIGIFSFILLPVAIVVFMSFISTSTISFPPSGYSLHWYKELIGETDFIKSFILSVEVSLLAMIISLILGLLASIGLVKHKFKGKSIMENLFTSPLIVPAIITGIALYIFLFSMQKMTGIKLAPSFLSLVLAHVIITLPWTVRLITIGLQNLNPAVEEAAYDLGAKPLQVYWKIILPSIRPSLVAAGIFAFIFSFNNLEVSLMLVSPGETTLPIEILDYVFWRIDPLIAAVSTVQIVIVAVLMIIADRFIGLSKIF